MTNHYYTNNLDIESEIKKLKFKLLNNELTFYTDNGVFSKGTIDYGTRVLVENCEIKEHYKSILDLGCGYGPVGISLAKEFSNLVIDMVDVNLRALELAKRNALENNVKNVNIYESYIYNNIVAKFDCILTNPPIRAGKTVVHEMLEKSYDYLNDQGALFVVIQKKQGAPSAKEKMETVFGNCEVVCKDKGYYILKSKKNTNLD
jgi:16S rRNA (guanine1207-N2)-methyltransferase